eukprot:5392038-Ditylum_brightwellii.AAC.1
MPKSRGTKNLSCPPKVPEQRKYDSLAKGQKKGSDRKQEEEISLHVDSRKLKRQSRQVLLRIFRKRAAEEESARVKTLINKCNDDTH